MADNNKVVVELGQVAKERGIYTAGSKYYKDNIVEYMGAAYIAEPTTPNGYVTVAPWTTDRTHLNTGWRVFADGNPEYIEEVADECVRQVNEAIDAYQPIVVEGDVSNAPDEEDLTSVNIGGTDVLKFKDKAYVPAAYSGMGRVYLRKNIVDGVNTLTQEMMQATNTIYVIQYDFTLGEDITVPNNCILEFDGGSLNNGTLVGNETKIVAPNYEIFKQGIIKYRGYKTSTATPHESSKLYDGLLLDGTFNTSNIGSNWTGLDNANSINADCAFRNFIKLHKPSQFICVPSHTYTVFSLGTITSSIDFSNSILNLANPNSVYDATIPIPEGTEETPLNVPTWIIAFSKTNGFIKNLRINGMFAEYKQTGVNYGNHAAIELFSNKNMTVENVTIKNYAACAIITHAPSSDSINNNLSLNNVEINTIGEHGIYCHSQGTIRLKDSKFINCSYNAEIGTRVSAIIRFVGQNDFSEGSYVRLEADDCLFYRDSDYIDPTGSASGGNISHCLFSYDGAESYDFKRCVFGGTGLWGFVLTKQSSDYYGKAIKIKYEVCDSPIVPYAYGGSEVGYSNFRIEAIRCQNVKKPFWFDYIEDSLCYFYETTISGNDANNNRKKVFKNCHFVENDDAWSTTISASNITYYFENCIFSSTLTTHFRNILITIYSNSEFIFENVVFDIPVRIFGIYATGNDVVLFKLNNCNIKRGYGDYNAIVSPSNDCNYKLSIDNVLHLNTLNTSVGLGIRPDSPATRVLLHSPGGPVKPTPLSTNKGDKWFDGTRYQYWNGTKWVDEEGVDLTGVTSVRGATTTREAMTLTSVNAGLKYYDTDLKKYVLWNGTAWTNLDGSALL